MTALFMHSTFETDAQAFPAIAWLCCLGLVVSFCQVILGMDLTTSLL